MSILWMLKLFIYAKYINMNMNTPEWTINSVCLVIYPKKKNIEIFLITLIGWVNIICNTEIQAITIETHKANRKTKYQRVNFKQKKKEKVNDSWRVNPNLKYVCLSCWECMMAL